VGGKVILRGQRALVAEKEEAPGRLVGAGSLQRRELITVLP